jgi:hypothetical protein
MELWATAVETARAGLAGVRIKQGTEGVASAVRQVSVLRGMLLYVLLLRLMGFISKANTTRFQNKKQHRPLTQFSCRCSIYNANEIVIHQQLIDLRILAFELSRVLFELPDFMLIYGKFSSSFHQGRVTSHGIKLK